MKKIIFICLALLGVAGCVPSGESRVIIKDADISEAEVYSDGSRLSSSARTYYKTCVVLNEDTSYELCTYDRDVYEKVLTHGKENNYEALIQLDEMVGTINDDNYIKGSLVDLRIKEEG